MPPMPPPSRRSLRRPRRPNRASVNDCPSGRTCQRTDGGGTTWLMCLAHGAAFDMNGYASVRLVKR